MSALDVQCASLSAMIAKQRPNQLNGAVGITTFISGTLRRGHVFSRKRTVGGYSEKTKRDCKGAKSKGLHVGRRVDQFVREFIVSGAYPKKSTTPAVNRRVTTVLNALSQRGIKPCAAQVLAIDRKLGVKSLIDAIGLDRKGTVWAIELKCTTDNVATHEQLYGKPANKTGCAMTNGMADTERHHHYLQSGFGAYALKQTYPSITQVKPCVVVCCTDGVRFYNVPPHFCNPLAFTQTALNKDILKAVPKCTDERRSPYVVRPWPHDLSGIEPLVHRLGYARIDRFKRRSQETAYAILYPASSKPESVCVAMCASRVWAKVPFAEQTKLLKSMVPAIRSIRRATPNVKILRAVFAPSPRGVWELACLKKALLDSSTI